MFLVSFFTSWQCRPRFGLAWSGSELSLFALYTQIYATLTYLRTKFKGKKPLVFLSNNYSTVIVTVTVTVTVTVIVTDTVIVTVTVPVPVTVTVTVT